MGRFSTFLTKLLKKLSSKVRLGRTRGRAGVIVTSILVRRTGAFGDVIDTTPVVRRLRQEIRTPRSTSTLNTRTCS